MPASARQLPAADPRPDPSRPVLVLPVGYGDGPEVAAHAAMRGMTVIGASSAPGDPAAACCDAFVTLPHVTDAAFDRRLAETLAAHGIGQVHASHYVIWEHLKTALPALAPGVSLSFGRSAFDLQADYRALQRAVAEAPPIPELDASPTARPAMGPVGTAGYLRAATSIQGESYEPKLLALIEAARRAPVGDIVEIGSLFGRTAAALAMLNNIYDLGQILCVDPWSPGAIDQGVESLKTAGQQFDWDAFRRIFEINVAPFAQGRLNYIHALSTEGAKVYAARRQIETEAFGRTVYEGAIGLLHIDGNHGYEHVLADVRDWTPRLKPGGWLVMDDYDWDWGDGPRRVTDEFLAAEAARIRLSFVRGGAMFIQLRD
jgi:hypothetical protein